MGAIFLVLGFALLVAGVGFIYWPAALVVAGALCIAAGVDVSRDKPDSQ